MNVYEYHFTSLRGAPMSLGHYQGQPLLLVNTASECGYTPQYYGLTRIYNEYREAGFVVIGMPCNDFGEQEPGEDEAIDEFCATEYRVNFPMTTKISATGLGAHPLFHDLRDEYGSAAVPRWNFHKYLFDRQGALVEFWPSRVEPTDSAITHQIERFLQSWIL